MKLTIFLFAIPILSSLSGLLLYRFIGKKQLFKLDSIQFLYAFVLAPLLFVWAKTFFYTLVSTQNLGIALSSNDVFILDTVFSTFLLFIYAFVVMHSLTKTFNVRMKDDPLYNIFHHSEYFHLWLTHLAMFGGVLSCIFI
ncbi:hypothetical protein KC686_03570, partial [Candidatus Woesebacteria bacterium]|nr:hypothetical protein [Candidatus Woesebacteria bacterium]